MHLPRAAPDTARRANPGVRFGSELVHPGRSDRTRGGLNLYGYAGGDPVNYSDPLRLCPVCDIADFGFFARSAYKAWKDPSRQNLRDLALDGVGLLPIVPSIGMVRRIGDAAEFARKIPGKKQFRGPDGPAAAYAHLKKNHGVDPNDASHRLHKLKEGAGMSPDDDVEIGATGDVYNARSGERLGTLTDKSLGSAKTSPRDRQ